MVAIDKDCRIKMVINEFPDQYRAKILYMNEKWRANKGETKVGTHGRFKIASSECPEITQGALYLWGAERTRDNTEMVFVANGDNDAKKAWFNRFVRSVGLWAKNNKTWENNDGYADITINKCENKLVYKVIEENFLGGTLYETSNTYFAVFPPEEKTIRTYGVDISNEECDCELDEDEECEEDHHEDRPKVYKLKIPALIFIMPNKADAYHCAVWAMVGEFDGAKTELRIPLLPNVGGDGMICFGQNYDGDGEHINKRSGYKQSWPKSVREFFNGIYTFWTRDFDAMELHTWDERHRNRIDDWDRANILYTKVQEGTEDLLGGRKYTMHEVMNRLSRGNIMGMEIVETRRLESPRKEL